MQPGDDMGSVDLIEVRSGRWLCPLQWLAVAVLLMILPAGAVARPGNATASAASSTHVYLLRGVLNIFSLGLDDIASKLRQQGFNVTITKAA